MGLLNTKRKTRFGFTVDQKVEVISPDSNFQGRRGVVKGFGAKSVVVNLHKIRFTEVYFGPSELRPV